jgi:hypothetical protein
MVAETTIEDTVESEAIAMTTVAMLLVELIATAATIDMDVEETSDEVVATTIATTEVVTEVATVMASALVKLPLLLLMATQPLVERVGSHMPEVEETLMTDTVVDFNR